MNIYLIGLPGAGKSTVGKLLATELRTEFIDLDSLVEKDSLMFIDDLVEQYGIEKFRELETLALKNLNVSNAVIACGGGIVENRLNKDLMNGLIIYLDTDNDLIEKRIVNDYPRPLLREYTIEDLNKKRFLMYQHFSNLNISNNKSLDLTVTNIISKLNEIGFNNA